MQVLTTRLRASSHSSQEECAQPKQSLEVLKTQRARPAVALTATLGAHAANILKIMDKCPPSAEGGGCQLWTIHTYTMTLPPIVGHVVPENCK